IAMLLVGGVGALMSATVIMGLPFAFVMIAVMIGLMRALRSEAHRTASVQAALPSVMAGRSAHAGQRSWRTGFNRVLSYPSITRAEQHLEEVVRPALDEVAAEIGERGTAAVVSERTDPDGNRYVELCMEPETPSRFCYEVHLVRSPIPSYAG